MDADLLITNGHLVDEANSLDGHGSLAVKDGRIVAAGDVGGIPAQAVIDAKGCWVVPGLIDFHAHVFLGGTDSGISPDLATLPSGVTAVVDQGSSGVVNHRMLLQLLSRAVVKSKIFMHVTPCGQATVQHPEFLKPETWNKRQIRAALENAEGAILGLKIRISKHVVLGQGMAPFHAAVDLAREIGTRLVVHVTDPPVPQGEIASRLGEGDVFCHMYHGTGHSILENGRVLPEVAKARDRGVLFDSAHGSANFSYPVAEAAIARGFLPDIIGTDLTAKTWLHRPLFDLPHLMSKFRLLGLTLPQIVTRVTANPAKAMGMAGEIGCLKPGAAADITLLRDVPGIFEFHDSHGNVKTGSSLLTPQAVIVNGRLQYQRSDLAFS